MADNTKIEWTEATWNPLVGCTIISPGCTNCYAMKEAHRQQLCAGGLGRETHYTGTTKLVKGKPVWTGQVNLAPDHILTAPLRWRKPKQIFVCAHGDLFHESVPDEWIDKVFAVMALAPQHTFQVLTKRSRRMREYLSHERRPHQVARGAVDLFRHRMLPKRMPLDDRWPVRSIGDIDLPDDITMQVWPLPNVWLGVSAEDQARADERIPDLLATPAAVRWLSAEPLLGPVDLRSMQWPDGSYFDALEGWHTQHSSDPGIDWVVAGGESGQGARPMHPDWARALRDQCAHAGGPFFFKQWGNWHPATQTMADGSQNLLRKGERSGEFHSWGADGWAVNVGKGRAGRLLDGVEHNGMPEAKD